MIINCRLAELNGDSYTKKMKPTKSDLVKRYIENYQETLFNKIKPYFHNFLVSEGSLK